VNDETGDGKILRPLSGPHAFFRRIRVLVGGTVVEDIDDANRVAEMMNILSPQHVRDNIDIEGFDLPNAEDLVSRGVDLKALVTQNAFAFLSGIMPGKGKTALMKLLPGIFNQPKMIPLRYCPISLELEHVGNATDCILYSEGAIKSGTTTILDAGNKCKMAYRKMFRSNVI
jgi:hypothetical protein